MQVFRVHLYVLVFFGILILSYEALFLSYSNLLAIFNVCTFLFCVISVSSPCEFPCMCHMTWSYWWVIWVGVTWYEENRGEESLGSLHPPYPSPITLCNITIAPRKIGPLPKRESHFICFKVYIIHKVKLVSVTLLGTNWYDYLTRCLNSEKLVVEWRQLNDEEKENLRANFMNGPKY